MKTDYQKFQSWPFCLDGCLHHAKEVYAKHKLYKVTFIGDDGGCSVVNQRLIRYAWETVNFVQLSYTPPSPCAPPPLYEMAPILQLSYAMRLHNPRR